MKAEALRAYQKYPATAGRGEDLAEFGALALILLVALVALGLALLGLALTTGSADGSLAPARSSDTTETEVPWVYESQDCARCQLVPGAVYSR